MKIIIRNLIVAIAIITVNSNVLMADDSSQKISREPASDVPVYISKPIVPTPPEYLVSDDDELKKDTSVFCGNKVVEAGEECDDGNLKDGDGCSADCKAEKRLEERSDSLCGNGIVNQGEECDGVNGCAQGEVCHGCVCDKQEAGICGNGILEEGEQCDGEDSLCRVGLVCRQCLCVSSNQGSCGDGVIDAAEECGEPGLAECGPQKECTECRCVPFGCGFANCPEDSRCRVQYCRDQEGNCVVGDPELVGGFDVERYGSGTLDIPECCARIQYELYAGFNPCTGGVDDTSYEVRIGSVSRTNESQCYCAIQEPDGSYVNPDGQVVDCHDAVNRNADVQVNPQNGAPPRIQVTCSNCCGDQISTERTLEAASSRSPINCSVRECP